MNYESHHTENDDGGGVEDSVTQAYVDAFGEGVLAVAREYTQRDAQEVAAAIVAALERDIESASDHRAGSVKLGVEADRSSHELIMLAQINGRHAMNILKSIGDHQDADVRAFAACHLIDLTKYDTDGGVELWHRMVSDPDATVRELAYEDFDAIRYDAMDSEEASEYLAGLGLTWEDAFRLTQSYMVAEYGRSY